MKYPLTYTTVNPNGRTAVAVVCVNAISAGAFETTLFPTMIEPGSPGRKVKLP